MREKIPAGYTSGRNDAALRLSVQTMMREFGEALQNFHGDQGDIVRLPLFPNMISHFVDNALAHFGSRSFSQAANSKHQPLVSEVFSVLIGCLRNAVTENQEPVAADKLDRVLNGG
jgi:hypothetical protein